MLRKEELSSESEEFSNAVQFDRSLSRILGDRAALFLGELMDRESYHRKRGELIDDPKYGRGWFYHTIDKVEERIGMSRRSQNTVIRNLMEAGIIEVCKMGFLSRRHFRINFDKLREKRELSKKMKGSSDFEDKIVTLFIPDINQSVCANRSSDMCELVSPACANRSCESGVNAHTLYIEKKKEKTKENKREKKEPTSLPATSSLPTSQNSFSLENGGTQPSAFKNLSSLEVISEEPCLPKEPLVKRKENIAISDKDHATLVEKHGLELTERCYEELSEWKRNASPTQVKKHSSDYGRINKWVLKSIKKSDLEDLEIKLKEERLAKWANNSSGWGESKSRAIVGGVRLTEYDNIY